MKKVASYVISILIIISLIPNAWATEEVASGNLTSTISYTLYNNGVLDIDGNGEMPNLTKSNKAYLQYADDIVTVTLDDGITSIGKYNFYKCNNLTEINLDNITYVGAYAFYGCVSLDIPTTIEHGVCAYEFKGDSQIAFEKSLEKYNTAIEYLNEVYLKTDTLAFNIEYCSPADIKTLQLFVNSITKNCTTELEKAMAIYNWVDTNIAYGTSSNSYSAIDVFRNGEGICSGQSQLLSTLFKLAGIRSSVFRGYKASMAYITLGALYKQGQNTSHQWVMAYVNGQWYLFDSIFNYNGITNVETMAKGYFVEHIDGVVAYTEKGIDAMSIETELTDTYYINHQYLGYCNGELAKCSCANLQVGGCLHYNKCYYRSKTSCVSAPAGWSIITSNDLSSYILDNGVCFGGGFYPYNNTYIYLTTNGESARINPTDDMTLINNNLYITVGSEIDCRENYPNTTVISSNETVASVENNVIKTLSVGQTTLTFKYRRIVLNVYDENTFTFKNQSLIESLYEVTTETDLSTDTSIATETDVATETNITTDTDVSTTTNIVTDTNVEEVITVEEYTTPTELATDTEVIEMAEELPITTETELVEELIATNTDIEEVIITNTDVEEFNLMTSTIPLEIIVSETIPNTEEEIITTPIKTEEVETVIETPIPNNIVADVIKEVIIPTENSHEDSHEDTNAENSCDANVEEDYELYFDRIDETVPTLEEITTEKETTVFANIFNSIKSIFSNLFSWFENLFN